MPTSQDIILILSKDDIIACTKEMGIAEEAITDDVLYYIKKGVQSAFLPVALKVNGTLVQAQQLPRALLTARKLESLPHCTK